MKKIVAAVATAIACVTCFGFVSCSSDKAKNYSDIGMAGMTVNEERLKQVDFTEGYYESAQVLTVKADNTAFDACTTAAEVEAILSAKDSKYTVGTQNGTTGYMYSAGDDGFGYEGFKNLTTKGYTTGALALTDLTNGKIDAVILDMQPSLMIGATLNASSEKVKVIKDIQLTAETYAYAIKKGNTELKESVNTLLAEMKADKSLDALINSYFDGTATFSYKNKTTKPKADDFVVATNAYFPPFESYSGDKFVGVDIEIAYKIATKLGKTLYIKDMEFDSIIQDVNKG